MTPIAKINKLTVKKIMNAQEGTTIDVEAIPQQPVRTDDYVQLIGPQNIHYGAAKVIVASTTNITARWQSA